MLTSSSLSWVAVSLLKISSFCRVIIANKAPTPLSPSGPSLRDSDVEQTGFVLRDAICLLGSRVIMTKGKKGLFVHDGEDLKVFRYRKD